MLFYIVLIHAGILPALFVFLLWRLATTYPELSSWINTHSTVCLVLLECLPSPWESVRLMMSFPLLRTLFFQA